MENIWIYPDTSLYKLSVEVLSDLCLAETLSPMGLRLLSTNRRGSSVRSWKIVSKNKSRIFLIQGSSFFFAVADICFQGKCYF